MNPIIRLEHVTKAFRPRRAPGRLLKGDLLRAFRGVRHEPFIALRDLSFDVAPGESVGIIGRNGSGKSTLLKLIAGVTVPTQGDVSVYGRVASLLELGAGFHPYLTGRENVFLNAAILGMSRARTVEMFDRIVEFSGVGDFIDHPVETYSSGMYVRLAFAVAVHVDPDVFLVDEVLAVGDEAFQRKCRRRIGELKEQGKTILFVSHDLGVVNTLCDRVILLHGGEMVVRDTAQDTIQYYLRLVGGESSTAVLRDGRSEVVFNNGRLSLFHHRRELTAPDGIQVCLRSMEQDHAGMAATWHVEMIGGASCVARGRLPRLPAVLVWRLRLEGDSLQCGLALECDRDVSIEFFDVLCALRTAYRRWLYGEMSGVFPDITPEDVTRLTLVSPAVSCREVAAMGVDDDSEPAVFARMDSTAGFWRMQWANADYLAASRLLCIGGRVPDQESLFTQGVHELVSFKLELGGEPDAIRHRFVARNTLACGGLSAHFAHGQVRLRQGEVELTQFVHGYASMLIGDLWNDSSSFRWDPVHNDGVRLRATGHSRRFPFRQHWTLQCENGGCRVRIELEALEALDVQEYHFSVGLRTDYDSWRSDHEEGHFDDFIAGEEDWRHMNRLYAPGHRVAAMGAGLPTVLLEAGHTGPPVRMTAINTGFSHQARVLQALRTPDAGCLHFEPGTHLFFEGTVFVRP